MQSTPHYPSSVSMPRAIAVMSGGSFLGFAVAGAIKSRDIPKNHNCGGPLDKDRGAQCAMPSLVAYEARSE